MARCLQLPLLLLGSCPGSLAVRCSTARSCRGPKSANLDVHFALGKVLGITSLRKSVIIHGRVLHRGSSSLRKKTKSYKHGVIEAYLEDYKPALYVKRRS